MTNNFFNLNIDVYSVHLYGKSWHMLNYKVCNFLNIDQDDNPFVYLQIEHFIKDPKNVNFRLKFIGLVLDIEDQEYHARIDLLRLR